MSSLRILYLDSYTRRDSDSEASDEIGYGITASSAIKSELRAQGVSIDDLASLGIGVDSKLGWIHASYALIADIDLRDYDAIFIFHICHHFPSEVRRILCQRGCARLPIVGYTHGSHFDPSDTFREHYYPGMRAADLGNLLSLDRVLVVSNYFRRVLLQHVGSWSETARAELEARIVVSGLPINGELIDAHRADTRSNRTRVIFNHSPTQAKDPETFFRIMEPILRECDVELVVTRRFGNNAPGSDQLRALERKYGERIITGNTLPMPAYFRMLWSSHIQVSTARHESLGIATLEAMHAHNCAILPNRQSYPEIVDNFNVYSSEQELVEMLAGYIRDPGRRAHAANHMRVLSCRHLAPIVASRIRAAIESCRQRRAE